ncbi:ion channel [Serratia sp. D1N4]
MAANKFSLKNGRLVEDFESFINEEESGVWSDIIYLPDFFGGEERSPRIFRDREFLRVSFKSKCIKNVRFINCTFKECLLMGALIENCDFNECKFIDTNTAKIKINRCLIDPISFSKNFDFKNDANIAIDLYHELYKNSRNESQPSYASESLYMMKVAEGCNLDYKLKEGKISLFDYLKKRFSGLIYKVTSGYGLKINRIFYTLIFVIILIAGVNFIYSAHFFKTGVVNSYLDSLYFTCVTITTLGYGDIYPVTSIGRVAIIFESLLGFVMMSLFVSAFINKVLRS